MVLQWSAQITQQCAQKLFEGAVTSALYVQTPSLIFLNKAIAMT